MDLEGGIKIPACKPFASVRNAQHGGDRDLDARGNLKSLLGVERDTTGGERHPDTGLAIGVPQAADFEVADRDEIDQISAGPDKARRVKRDMQRAKWQVEFAAPELDLCPVRRFKRCRQAAIVEVAGSAQARIIRIGDASVPSGNRKANA